MATAGHSVQADQPCMAARQSRFLVALVVTALGALVLPATGTAVPMSPSAVSEGLERAACPSGDAKGEGRACRRATASRAQRGRNSRRRGGRRNESVSQPVAEAPTSTPTPPTPASTPQPAPSSQPAPTPQPETTPEPAPAPTPSPSPSPSPAPAPANSIYWGAWISDHLTGGQAPWDMGAVTKFEQMAGKKLSIVNFSAPFANCSSSKCSYYNFPAGEFNNIRSHGAIPFYSWGSQSIPVPSNLSEPNFQLADVIAGAHDTYIRQFATAAKNWGKPFFLRFNWEMNGGWFTWSEGVNGNKKGEYVAAWRHVHDIFTEVGATNATWVWCPNVDPEGQMQNLSSLYPGDAYVDWTGLDGYNWGTNPARPDRWRSFDSLYRSTYDKITGQIAPSKPMIVSEVGSTEHGGSKASWIKDMLTTVPANYPKIRGLLYFEKYDDGMDWPLATSSSATSAFAAGIQDPAYADNRFGSLGFGPVPPAS
jgi:mannan endo-1,4-beta-mannosidase